jgi:GDP-4-dehydro-6-deoxy-D-mannose reductase
VKVLVTGAGGFVAPHLVELLRAERPRLEIFGTVRPQTSVARSAGGGIAVLEADLNDPTATAALVEEVTPDRIVHLAGQSSVHRSWIDPGGTLRTNVLGLVNILDAVRRHGLRPEVLVVGSAEEYGLVRAEEIPLKEETPLRPSSPYAVSKVAQAALARLYGPAGGMRVVLTRTFPHTGPGRGEAFAESSFARQIAEVEAGLRPPVLRVGNLEAVRDYTDVRDVVRAYWTLLEKGEQGEVYNVCSGRGRRIGGLLDELLLASGVRVEVRVEPARLRPSDVPELVGDPTRIHAATGWEPRIPLEQTLRDLLEDWRQRIRAPASSSRAGESTSRS